jgi:hypothetical protein
MKRLFLFVAVVAVVSLVAFSGAFAADAKKDAKAEPKTQTVTGEIVDLGCYLDHGAHGEKHAECALHCVQGGMPMGLLADGNKVYVLTLSHENGDPYAKCKEWVAKQVKVTGKVMTGGGMQALEVDAVELAPAAAAK